MEHFVPQTPQTPRQRFMPHLPSCAMEMAEGMDVGMDVRMNEGMDVGMDEGMAEGMEEWKDEGMDGWRDGSPRHRPGRLSRSDSPEQPGSTI